MILDEEQVPVLRRQVLVTTRRQKLRKIVLRLVRPVLQISGLHKQDDVGRYFGAPKKSLIRNQQPPTCISLSKRIGNLGKDYCLKDLIWRIS
jgi:hypothetical protein